MAYVNPIGKGLTFTGGGRIDEGVDFVGSGPLYAMSSGTITSISKSGWPGTNYILLHMDDNKYVYYAENIQPNVHAGERVTAGQLIGMARGYPPYIEVGWATPTPGNALAHSHYTEGQQTAEGKDFAALLNKFGWKIPGAASSSSLGGSGVTLASNVTPSTSAALPGCVPLIGVIYLAIQSCKRIRRVQSPKRNYRQILFRRTAK
jgi:hypothetical protein